MSKVLVIKGADFYDNALDTIQFDAVHCTGISLDKSTLSLTEIGGTASIAATVTPSDCDELVHWSSSDTACCTVNNNGLVTAVGVGSSTITATCGQYSATCAVDVEIEAASIQKWKNGQANPANNESDNYYTTVEVFPLSDNQWDIRYMVMFDYITTDELIAGHEYPTVADGVASLPAWSESGNIYVNRSRNAGVTNYPMPIRIPEGCTKIRTATPLTGYGARVLWFKKNVRCGSSPTTGTDNTKRGYFEAKRLAPAVRNADYEWDYTATEKEFEVPEGYDSFIVTWKSGDGVTNFHDMPGTDVAKFKVYFA